MKAISRPCSVGNLDPANDIIPYDATFDVRDLVSVEEVMEREELGPNGGVLWAMEEVEANFEWLEEQLNQCGNSISNGERVLFANLTQRKRLFSIHPDSQSLQPITWLSHRFYNDLKRLDIACAPSVLGNTGAAD